MKKKVSESEKKVCVMSQIIEFPIFSHHISVRNFQKFLRMRFLEIWLSEKKVPEKSASEKICFGAYGNHCV